MTNRLLAAVVAFLAISSVALAADPTAPSVHVSGRGLVQVAPDLVVIDLTATTTDDDLIRVRETSDKDARTIMTLAKKNGVAASGFEVSRLELSLDYNEQLRRQIYQVERDLTLRLNDLAKLDALLADLLRERNLQVVGINFETSKSRQHEFEARGRAVADAKEKAAHLAQLNGFKLGQARDIHVTGESHRPFLTSIVPVVGSTAPRRSKPGQRPTRNIAQGSKQERRQFVAFQPANNAQGEKKQFALGMIEITANVSIEFELVK